MMTQTFVSIANYQFLSEADVCKVALQNQGFDVVLADAELVNTDWFLGNAVGYIKLQVPSDQAQAASMILQRVREEQGRKTPNVNEADVCLACGTGMNPNDKTCRACGWSYATNEENET